MVDGAILLLLYTTYGVFSYCHVRGQIQWMLIFQSDCYTVSHLSMITMSVVGLNHWKEWRQILTESPKQVSLYISLICPWKWTYGFISHAWCHGFRCHGEFCFNEKNVTHRQGMRNAVGSAGQWVLMSIFECTALFGVVFRHIEQMEHWKLIVGFTLITGLSKGNAWHSCTGATSGLTKMMHNWSIQPILMACIKLKHSHFTDFAFSSVVFGS